MKHKWYLNGHYDQMTKNEETSWCVMKEHENPCLQKGSFKCKKSQTWRR